jgi:FkbM family methyltransferase
MSRSLQQLLRQFVPNIGVRIRHVEEKSQLEVRCREHLGLIARGAKAYEPQYVSVLRTLLKPGDTVFDIGANIGFYSVLFSNWVGSRGRVVAYEPDPTNLKLLQRNLELNGCENAAVRPVALSNRSGRHLFSVDRVTRSTGHLGPGATYGETIFGTGKEDLISVVASTLDDEVSEYGAPNLIKMDIEGGEYDALTGGILTLQNHRPLIVSELNTWTREHSKVTEKAVQTIKYLDRLSYSLWDLDTGIRFEPDFIPWMFLAVPQESQKDLQITELLSV